MAKILHLKIVEQCRGCKRVTEDGRCKAYIDPAAQWRSRKCPLASHLRVGQKEKKKVRIGQQKQRKK